MSNSRSKNATCFHTFFSCSSAYKLCSDIFTSFIYMCNLSIIYNKHTILALILNIVSTVSYLCWWLCLHDSKFPSYIRLLASNVIPLNALINHLFPSIWHIQPIFNTALYKATIHVFMVRYQVVISYYLDEEKLHIFSPPFFSAIQKL